MSNYVDLNLLVKKPIEFKGLDNKIYKIPGNLSTGFVLQMKCFYKRMQDLNEDDDKSAFDELKEIVAEILNLDKNKGFIVDIDYINEYFDDLNVLKKIFAVVIEHITKNESDPNFNSPDLQTQQK